MIRLVRGNGFFLGGIVLAGSLIAIGQNQSMPDPHEVPVMDGQAGPCSVAFTVTDINGAPVYDARIRVQIKYGFAGIRLLDLEAATNVDGKTQFKGLPKKVKGQLLYFNASKGKAEGSATYDPEKSCGGESASIVLSEKQGSS
ncbi:MAG TPA: hypothetical protein VEH30_01805 [Terriglobales bacterium]|nr:hypothetical protein [Terriglobales bacterium]